MATRFIGNFPCHRHHPKLIYTKINCFTYRRNRKKQPLILRAYFDRAGRGFWYRRYGSDRPYDLCIKRDVQSARSVHSDHWRRLRRRPVAQGRAMSNGCTFSPPAIRGFDGSKRSRTSRFLTSERATTKAPFMLLACRSATLKKALPK